MKAAFFLFILSFLATAPAFSSPMIMTPEEDAKDAIATNREVDELFGLAEDEMVETQSTAENTTPTVIVTEETAL